MPGSTRRKFASLTVATAIMISGCARAPDARSSASSGGTSPPPVGPTSQSVAVELPLVTASIADSGAELSPSIQSDQSTGNSAVGRALDAAEQREALGWMLRCASANGDASPTQIEAVLSYRQHAVRSMFGLSIDSDPQVIVAVADGTFNDAHFDRPPGVATRSFDELVCIFDAKSGGGLDVVPRNTVEQGVANLGSLGAVARLSP